MDLSTEWISYGTESGPLPGYRAKPGAATDPMPAVIVIQEAWGVDEHIMDVTRRVATAGYLALAPDLYAVGGERPEPLTPERMAALKAFVNTMPRGAWTDSRAREEALGLLPRPQRDQVAESMAPIFDLDPKEVTSYPHALIGSADQLTEDLHARRERWSASYVVVQAGSMDAFAPVVAALAGT